MAIDSSSSPYDSAGYQKALLKFNGWAPTDALNELNRYGDIFKNEFNQQVGRDPTKDEASRFYADIVEPTGSFPGGQFKGIPQLMDITKSYVGNAFGNLAQTEKQAKTDQASKDAAGTVGDLFKSTLGRDATQEELDHFGKMVGSGQADAYTLGQALQQLPEYTQKQDATQRASLESELSNNDTQFFSKQVAPSIEQQYALAGRSIDPGQSSALDAAFANAAKDLNTQRSNYIATVGQQDYQFDRQSAINNYLNQTNRNYQLQDMATNRGYQLQDQSTARANDITDYSQQQDAYQQFLQNYGRRSSGNGLGTLIGTGVGAIGGGIFGGPGGAAIGAQAGGALGGVFNKY